MTVFQPILPLQECADPTVAKPLYSVADSAAEPLQSVADSAGGGAAPTETS
jgi:hypothetical protein